MNRNHRFYSGIYSVYAISADRFDVITMTCMVKRATKEEAIQICNERKANVKADKYAKSQGKRIKYIYIRTDDGDELEKLRAKVDAINTVSIPRREKYRDALRAKVANDAKQYQREQDALREHMSVVGWHYDNQQRVNEYKGTMRG